MISSSYVHIIIIAFIATPCPALSQLSTLKRLAIAIPQHKSTHIDFTFYAWNPLTYPGWLVYIYFVYVSLKYM